MQSSNLKCEKTLPQLQMCSISNQLRIHLNLRLHKFRIWRDIASLLLNEIVLRDIFGRLWLFRKSFFSLSGPGANLGTFDLCLFFLHLAAPKTTLLLLPPNC